MTDMNSSGAQPAPDLRPGTILNDPHRDLGAAIFFATWSVIGWYAVAGDAYLWSDFGADPGPSLMPAIVLSLLSVGSFAMLLSALVRLRRARPRKTNRSLFSRLLTPILFVGSLVAVVPLMQAVGFLAAGAVFSAGWMFVLHDSDRGRSVARRLLETAMATIIGLGLIFYVFVRVIHVPLP